MVVTFKVFLDERRQKKDLTYPLRIRVTVNRKHKEIPLNIHLQKKEWDNKNQRVKPKHPNAKLIQLNINNTLNSIQEKALLFEKQGKIFESEDIITSIKNKVSEVSFFGFAQQQISDLICTGRIGNATAYKNATDKLQKFTGKNLLRFEEIDYNLLERFSNSMLQEKLSINSIAMYMREIRALYNKAINLNIVDPKYYPFRKFKIKTSKTINRSLTLDEMRKICNAELNPNESVWHYQNLFLLSFCLIGINFSDLLTLKLDNMVNGRVIFHRKKTKKIYSIKIHEEAKKRLDVYLQETGLDSECFVLPFVMHMQDALSLKKRILQVIHNTNEGLKQIAMLVGIKGNISTYYARYTWANIAKSLGYSKDLIAEALGHEYGNRVTGIYLDNYDNEIIDEMNEKILRAVFY